MSEPIFKLQWFHAKREPAHHYYLCFGGLVIGEVEAHGEQWCALAWLPSGDGDPLCATAHEVFVGELPRAKALLEQAVIQSMRMALTGGGKP